MPELPDITVYVERLSSLIVGQPLTKMRLGSPFILRTVEPRPDDFTGLRVKKTFRTGKRIVLAFEQELYAVIHLMIAGRLKWRAPGASVGAKQNLLALDFPKGTILLTEATSKHRASLHLLKGGDSLGAFCRGGVDPLSCSAEELQRSLARRNRTLKRALTDPAIVDGIGNAYSDEILHRARLSPFALTSGLTPFETERLRIAAAAVLNEWIDRLRSESGPTLPEKVVAFHPAMAVHGKYGKPCPVCGTPIQRIVYAENEANYCPKCQTGGRVLADRALSRLLKDYWPKTVEELERL